MDLEDYIGQTHLIGDNGPITKMIKNDHFQSIILYGNPGIGKTTLANIIAINLELQVFNTNASDLSSKELKDISESTSIHKHIILIMDEIHRLDTRKQNFLLPFVESEKIYLIGTTTENPYYSVNAALRSRVLLFKLNPIEKKELVYGLYKINLNLNPDKILSQETYELIYITAGGDVRMATNILKFLLSNYDLEEIDKQLITSLFETNVVYDKTDTNHHDLLSAFQKTIRASDVNAALHYLARLLKVGDYASLLRRLEVIAYEDIGLGNPNACMRTRLAIEGFKEIGMPEGRILLANTVIDLCLSLKSTSAHDAILMAFNDLNSNLIDAIPNYITYNQTDDDKYDREKVKKL
ncbi:MAG: AAA family ATPase, partial [Mycoplasmatales bacterium]